MKIGLMTVTQSMRAAPPIGASRRTSAPAPTPGLPYFRPRGVFAGTAYWPTACDLDFDLDVDAPAPERRLMPS